ncbi:hypothetical protein B0H10DRAFT_936055 [Mycena sp. CBHHK59/15]|nr:hypothetical protein B0H10DRAFT_936055 [Mycena sp. CBHHK59/15]
MPNKTTGQVTDFYKSNLIELDLEMIVSNASQSSSTADLAPDGDSNTRQTSPVDAPVSSAPSPLASAVTPEEPSSASVNVTPEEPNSASVNANVPIIDDSGSGDPGPDTTQNLAPVSTLSANELWDSMDPGSGGQSPTAAPPSPKPDAAIAPVPGPVLGSIFTVTKPVPPMASLTREEPPPTEESTSTSTSMHPHDGAVPSQSPRAGLKSLKIQKYHAPHDSPPATVPLRIEHETSGTETMPRPHSPQRDEPMSKFSTPVMSSLNYDPSWSFYDADGVNHPIFGPPNRYSHDGAPARPYSPSQPVPYVAPLHSPTRPPVGVVTSRPIPMLRTPYMPYPYYIPPPYPSTTYHPYSSYKS